MIFRYPDPANAETSESLLYVEVVAEGRAVTIDVRGEVDIATVELLNAGIQYGMGMRPDRVSLHLSQVSFFGAVGLRALLTARKQASEQAAELVLTAPSWPVLTVLELAEARELFQIESEPLKEQPP